MVENIKLRNMATNALLEMDKVTTPNYILESVTWGEVKGEHHSYKYVGQAGVYVTGTSLGTRDVQITGWIVANSEEHMTSLKSTINRFVNPQQEMELRYDSYLLRFLPDSSVKYSVSVAENNEVICKFKISGLAADPLFKDNVETKVLIAGTNAQFRFPMIIGKPAIQQEFPNPPTIPTVVFGLRQPSLIANVLNSGAVSTGMRIVFKALGTLTGPSLTNVYTQEFLKINKTMYSGESVEVITTIGEKKVASISDDGEINYFKYLDLDSTWLQLDVGDNLFRYDADNGIDNLEVYIYFSDKYLEVQKCY